MVHPSVKGCLHYYYYCDVLLGPLAPDAQSGVSGQESGRWRWLLVAACLLAHPLAASYCCATLSGKAPHLRRCCSEVYWIGTVSRCSSLRKCCCSRQELGRVLCVTCCVCGLWVFEYRTVSWKVPRYGSAPQAQRWGVEGIQPSYPGSGEMIRSSWEGRRGLEGVLIFCGKP